MLSESNITIAKWCNICNAAPAEGTLWVEMEDFEGDYPLDSCESCAMEQLGS